MQLVTYSGVLINNPKDALEITWKLIKGFDLSSFATAIYNQVSLNIKKLDSGNPQEKGAVIGAFTAEVLLNSISPVVFLKNKKLIDILNKESLSFQ